MDKASARLQEDIYRRMEFERAPVIRTLEKTIQTMFPKLVGNPRRVLEVGAGDGFLKRTLRSTCDWTEFDHYRAKSRNGRGNFVLGDATNMPFHTNSFDAVVGFESFNAFQAKDLEKAVGESLRVLRPGGSFLIFHDFSISDPITVNILGKPLHRITKFKRGKKLPSTALEVVPPRNVARYERALEMFFHEHAGRAYPIKEPKEFNKYWEEVSPKKMITLFHDYVRRLISGNFADAQSSGEIGLEVIRRNGQRQFITHGPLWTGVEKKAAEYDRKISSKNWRYYRCEFVTIPYTVGRNKK